MKTAPRARESFTHDFKYAGRAYRLFKRERTKDAPYYVHFQAKKRRYKLSLQTNVQEVAVTKAKRFIDAVRAEKWDVANQLLSRKPKEAQGPQPSTIGEVFALYPSLARIADRSARNNVLAMRIVIEGGTGQSLDPKTFTLDGLTADLVDRYQKSVIDRYVREATPKTDNGKREARDRASRTSRSYVGQARSLFNGRLRLPEEYAKAGIILPQSIDGFMTCRLFGRSTKREYLAPPDSVLQSAFQEIEKLREVDSNSFLGFWFAVGAGLRRKEIQHLRWEHVIERDGAIWVSGGLGKDGEQIEVPMQKRAVDAIDPLRKEEGFALSERSLEWARRLNGWMKEQGWQTEKKMHELRAYVGSMLYAKSPVAAMRFMRHKSIRITEQFYVRYGTALKPIEVL
jgi:integrase